VLLDGAVGDAQHIQVALPGPVVEVLVGLAPHFPGDDHRPRLAQLGGRQRGRGKGQRGHSTANYRPPIAGRRLRRCRKSFPLAPCPLPLARRCEREAGLIVRLGIVHLEGGHALPQHAGGEGVGEPAPLDGVRRRPGPPGSRGASIPVNGDHTVQPWRVTGQNAELEPELAGASGVHIGHPEVVLAPGVLRIRPGDLGPHVPRAHLRQRGPLSVIARAPTYPEQPPVAHVPVGAGQDAEGVLHHRPGAELEPQEVDARGQVALDLKQCRLAAAGAHAPARALATAMIGHRVHGHVSGAVHADGELNRLTWVEGPRRTLSGYHARERFICVHNGRRAIGNRQWAKGPQHRPLPSPSADCLSFAVTLLPIAHCLLPAVGGPLTLRSAGVSIIETSSQTQER